MVETPRRDRVGLGVIGLGPSWEQVYRDPLKRLQNRLKIRLVYDPVEARSKSVASEIDAEVATSLHQLLTRPTLQGLLILDPGWCTNSVLELVSRSNRPAFLGRAVLRNAVQVIRSRSFQDHSTDSDISKQTSSLDDQLMPELGLRFTPSSCRLRELMATKLGPVRHIEIHYCPTPEFDETSAIVDWCSDIVGSPLNRIAQKAPPSTTPQPIEFESDSRDSHGNSQKTVRLWQRVDEPDRLQIELKCERGRTRLLSRTHIQWQTSREFADESLIDERTEIEILIDQFCRRALGGLNPIGRLSEFIRAHEVAQSLRSLGY